MNAVSEPTPEAVRAQTARILQSDRFRSSKKQKGFLKFVVDETLAGRGTRLKGFTIALAVYGRDESFDPQVDPIVRVEAGRLRRALEHYYLTDGKNDPVRIEIPKGAYMPTFQAMQTFPGEPEPLATGQKTRQSSTRPSLAVLPLENLSGTEDQDYFADGLTEELTAEIARYQEIQVIASQTTLHLRGQKVDPQKVGSDLDVRFLLTGNIRKDSKSIKISIRLLDSTTARQIWGESYTRKLTPENLISLQEEISSSAVGAMADLFGQITRRLSKESRKKPPKDLDAYDAVLRFYHYETVLTPDAFQEALAAIEKAVEIEPGYGLAWAVLGHLYADNHALGFCELENPLEKALTFALKGLALEPENQFVHDALTLVHFHRGDKAAFIKHLDRTLALNPNAPYIVGVAGWHLCLYGEWDRGLSLLQKGMQLNPYHPTWFYLATFMDCYHREDYESAYVEALKFNYPELFWDPLIRAVALAQLDEQQEAEKALKELSTLVPDFESTGRQLMGNYVKVPVLVESLITGLKKVGMTYIA